MGDCRLTTLIYINEDCANNNDNNDDHDDRLIG